MSRRARGWPSRRGGPVEPIRAGDTVFFDANEEHWHGAGPATFVTHLAMQEIADDGSDAAWGAHVGDAEYSPESRPDGERT